MKEVWKTVVGYPYYEVSNLGRVRSIKRLAYTRAGWPTYPGGHILKGYKRPYGYISINLCKPDGKYTGKLVHRLVLEAFIGPCPEGMQCCHYNDIKDDNRLENLRWDTHKANMKDAIRNERGVGKPKNKPASS